MSVLNVVIVEDEKKSMAVLKNLLETYCPEINVAGTAESVARGIEVIKTVNPDLVFLDIEMQSATGFDLLQSLEKLDFDVIFTTAYEHYALKAIKFSAIDYLLKPIDVNELKQAVAKVVKKRTKHIDDERLQRLIENLSTGKSNKISISTSEELVFVDVADIIRCEAKGAYTIFFIKGRNNLVTSKNLKEYEQLLSEHNFFRVHISHLINLHEVQRYIKTDGGSVEMKDGSRIVVATNRRQAFFERMRI